MTLSAIYALGAIAWPMAFVAVLYLLNGTGVSESFAPPGGGCAYAVAFALWWPLLLMGWDLFEAGSRRRGSAPAEAGIEVGTQSNAATIVGGAWALGALLAIINGRRGGHSRQSAKIIMLSLVLCIAFVLPTPGDGPRRSVANLTIAALQKTALNYAIGFFILGIVLASSPTRT